MKKMITYIDPPSGWKYGFPKVLPEEAKRRVREWLVEEGYPAREIESYGEYFYCRYWSKEVEN